MDIDSMIAVLQAAKAGKVIESKLCGVQDCFLYTASPTWDFYRYDYRVKPEPPREWVIDVDPVTGQLVSTQPWTPRGRQIKVREVLE